MLKTFGGQEMETQLEFEERKKRTGHSDVKTDESQVLFPPMLEEQTKDLMVDKSFCVFCGCFHKPDATLRCAFNRAITKIESKTVSHKRKTGNSQV
jgi:hypothetical protein